MTTVLPSQPGRPARPRVVQRSNGYSLIEIMVSVAILAIVAAAAIPVYEGYANEARIARSIQDIQQIQLILNDIYEDGGFVPSLAAAGISMVDPWGNPYQYLWLRGNPAPGLNGQRRRDKSMNPVNTDYDLYSMGDDGQTSAQFTAGPARDDVVRANDGDYVGLAADH